MLPGLVYEYEGIDGLKTGTTELAGHSFTGTAERNGMRLITVVMKAVDSKGVGSYKARFDATRAMMDYGFAQFTKQEIVAPGQTIEGAETIAIDKGKEDEVGIAVKDGISMVIKSGEKELYTPVFTPETELLEAEVEKGQVVGKVKLQKTEGEDLGYILEKDAGVDVVTTAAVERASWISLVFQGIGAFFAGLWGNVTDFVGGLF